MNILMVASDNNKDHGAFLSMIKLAELLEKQHGHRIVIVVPYDGNGTELIEARNFRYYIIPSYDWVIHLSDTGNIFISAKEAIKRICNLASINRISKAIKKEKIELVHINTSWCYVGAVAALREKKPLIWHIREFLEEDQGLTIWRRKSGYRLINRADRVIAISNCIRDKYEKILDKNRIEVVYNGIDPAGYLDKSHKILNNEHVELLIVGVLQEWKGQKEAVEACIRLFRNGFSNFTLRIVGSNDTEYGSELIKYVDESGCGKHIVFEGPTDTPEKNYQKADITFMCSTSEAFGRVTVEAMMGGSLVIGASCAGTIEIIRDLETGLLYNSGDADDLAEKIRYALEHKDEVRAIAEAGQNDMISRMTAGKNAQRINEVYSQIQKKIV